ncbi:testis-specific Y-encoded-like protein 6 [Ovis canadensis]|uniref:testis-specific Y-encoded-like protein 6 n=1 Tax=Ovis canadensis TaxID=37174 RepID=UPI003752C2B2
MERTLGSLCLDVNPATISQLVILVLLTTRTESQGKPTLTGQVAHQKQIEDRTGPQQCQKLLEETQVLVETSEGSSETVAFQPLQLPEEGGSPQAPADPSPTPQLPVAGAHGRGVAQVGLEEVGPPREGREATSASGATNSSLENGWEKALETCDTGRSESELTAGGKAAEAKTERGPIFSEAANQEERVEVEKPVGGEREVVEERRGVKQAKDEAGPPTRSEGLHLKALESSQLEVDAGNAQAGPAFLQVERRYRRVRQHYLQWRKHVIRHIPGFWVTAFRNHPQLSALIRGRDAEIFSYLASLEVKELRHPRMGYKFKFLFRRNPYFRNKWLVKEYEVTPSSQVVSLSTPLIWHPGHEAQVFLYRNQDLMCGFFAWFSDNSLPESDRIAEIIKEDLWPKALQYYLLDEAPYTARLLQIREPVETPRPPGFQSG